MLVVTQKLLIGLALLLAASAQALPMLVAPLVECSDAGLYQLLEQPQRQPALETIAGYRSVVKVALQQRTQTVPLELGQVFGVSVAVDDIQSDADWVPLELQIQHPPMVGHDGRLRSLDRMQITAVREDDGRFRNRALYILSEPRELVAGTWQFQLSYRGEAVCSTRFSLKGH